MRAAAVLLAAGVWAACAGPPAAPPPPPPTEAPVAEPVVRAEEVPSRPPAPAFVFHALDDSTVTFTPEAFAGRFLLIDFWASWCTPCIEEIPNITAVQADYADRGLAVLSVSLDLNRSDAHAFRQRIAPMDWHHAYAWEGFEDASVVAFGVDQLPHAVLIGPDGTLRAERGHLRRSLLRTTIDREITVHETSHAPSP